MLAPGSPQSHEDAERLQGGPGPPGPRDSVSDSSPINIYELKCFYTHEWLFCVAYVHKVYQHKWIKSGNFPSVGVFDYFKGEKNLEFSKSAWSGTKYTIDMERPAKKCS